MTAWLLDPAKFLALLVAVALITPVAAAVLWRARPGMLSLRQSILLGAAGPVLLMGWGVHNLVLEMVGFDRVASVFIIFALAIALGASAGRWARG